MASEKTIRLAGISRDSLTNGPGLRKVYFAQGCKHHCPGCFNESTWSFDDGKDFSVEELVDDLKDSLDYLDGITLSGGDPLEQYENFIPLVKYVNQQNKNVWAWTGYTWEQLMARVPNEPKLLEFLQELDVLVDGLFVLAKRYDDNDMHGKFKGSSNQRIIDVKKSLENNKVVLSKYDT